MPGCRPSAARKRCDGVDGDKRTITGTRVIQLSRRDGIEGGIGRSAGLPEPLGNAPSRFAIQVSMRVNKFARCAGATR
jgi:hypothetical protein